MSVLSSVCALTSVARIVRLQRGLAEELYVYKYRSRLAHSVKICTIRVTIEDIWKAFNKSQTDTDAILVNFAGASCARGSYDSAFDAEWNSTRVTGMPRDRDVR